MATRYYNRGNETILLDDYINKLEQNVDEWMNSIQVEDNGKWRNLTTDERNEARQYYANLVQELNNNPDEVIYQLGSGGFRNNIGINNITGRTDTAGVAAAYMSQQLRQMSPSKRETGKLHYQRNQSMFNSQLQQNIFGSDPEYFVELDPFVQEAKSRPLDKRNAITLQNLENYLNNIDNYYEFDDESDRQDAINRLKGAIALMKDEDPNNNLYGLGLLGLSDLGDYFTIDGNESDIAKLNELEEAAKQQQEQDQQQSDVEAKKQQVQDLIKDFKDFFNKKYGVKKDVVEPRFIFSHNIYDKPFFKSLNDQFDEYLKGLDENKIKTLINLVFFNKDIFRFDVWRDFAGDKRYLSNERRDGVIGSYIMEALFRARPDMFSQNNDGTYFIRYTKQKSNVARVYDPKRKEARISSLDKINYFVNKAKEEYLKEKQANELGINVDDLDLVSALMGDQQQSQEVQSQKNGGILKFADGGSTTPTINPLVDRLAWYKATFGDGDWTDNTILTGSDPTRSTSRRTGSIGTGDNMPGTTMGNAYDIQQKYWESGQMVNDVRSVYNTWKQSNPTGTYDQFLDYYNKNIDVIRSLSQQKMTEGAGSNKFDDLRKLYNFIYPSRTADRNIETGTLGNQEDIGSLLGPTNWSRNALFFGNDEAYKTDRYGLFDDNDQKSGFRINNEGKLEMFVSNRNGQTTEQKQSNGDSKVDPTGTKFKQPLEINDINNILKTRGLQYGPLIGSFTNAMYHNNAISDALKKYTKPVVIQPENIRSSVMDDLGTIRSTQNNIAQMYSRANQPLFSDADKQLNLMNQTQQSANEYNLKSNLQRNQYVDKTRQTAWNNDVYSAKSRVLTANKNIANLVQYLGQLGKIEQTRLTGKHSSIDNFIKDVAAVAQDNYTKEKQALYQNEVNKIKQYYTDEMKKINDRFELWKQANNKPNATAAEYNTAVNGDYNKAVESLMNTYKQLTDQATYKYLGIKTDNDYDDNWYNISNFGKL